MTNFKNYWKHHRFKVLSKRKEKYRTNARYRHKLKTRAKIVASIDRLFNPYYKYGGTV